MGPRRTAHPGILLRYETTIGEAAEALILAYGRYGEWRCPVGTDPQASAHVERFASEGREVVLLGFRHSGAAADFQRFWTRYSRVYGPERLRAPAGLSAPAPTLCAEAETAIGKTAPRALRAGGGAGAGRAAGRSLRAPVLRWRPGGGRRPDLRQALNEMESAGVQVRAVEFAPDGTIRLLTASRRDDR